jgi:hypothetical protein
MITPKRRHLALLWSIVLVTALLVQACDGSASPVPESTKETVATVEERTYELARYPLKTELNPGEQVVLEAVPLGREQGVPNLQWFLEPAPGYGEAYGELSSNTGPSVIYTAPDKYPVSVIVIAERAETGERDMIRFDVVGPPAEALSLVLRGAGGPLGDEKAQEVLLAALPFKDLLATAFAGQDVLLAVDMPNRQEPDARDLAYDYDWAKSEVDEFFAGSEVRILVPDGDERLVQLAALMAEEHLQQIGIQAYVEVVPGADLSTRMRTMMAAGLSVLTLTPQ